MLIGSQSFGRRVLAAVCRFLFATLSEDVALAELESAIPERLRKSLLRVGFPGAGLEADCIGFMSVENPVLHDQIPTNDQVVRLTRLHCDCWTTLFTPEVALKESQRWLRIFDIMLSEVGRFGLLAHFGVEEDEFTLSGPCGLSLGSKSLAGLQEDTFYEVCA